MPGFAGLVRKFCNKVESTFFPRFFLTWIITYPDFNSYLTYKTYQGNASLLRLSLTGRLVLQSASGVISLPHAGFTLLVGF